MNLIEFRIHPAIGIARVGNSDESYLSPEVPGQVDYRTHGEPFGENGPRDHQSRVKRRAVRFRVFAIVENYFGQKCAVPMTSEFAEVTWRFRFANKKCVSTGFSTVGTKDPIRNPNIDSYRSGLVIDSGLVKLLGKNKPPVELKGTFVYRENDTPVPQFVQSVTLGHAQTDSDGYLIASGGFGIAGYVPTSEMYPPKLGIDSDRWYDDTCDGPVGATVSVKPAFWEQIFGLKAGQATVYEALSAWFVSAPPRFAPPVQDSVTLYDLMYDRLSQPFKAKFGGVKWVTEGHPTVGPSGDVIYPDHVAVPHDVSFENHVAPILRRAVDVMWVSASTQVAPVSNVHCDVHFGLRAILKQPKDKSMKGYITGSLLPRLKPLIKTDAGSSYPVDAIDVDGAVAAKGLEQPYYMPRQEGCTLTRVQRALLKTLAEDIPPYVDNNLPDIVLWPGSQGPTPEQLDRAALEDCIGANFWPGIEVGKLLIYLLKNKNNWLDVFRLKLPENGDSGPSDGNEWAPTVDTIQQKNDEELTGPGDITKHLAVPWHYDLVIGCVATSPEAFSEQTIFECTITDLQDMWPAHRPQNVLPHDRYLLENYEKVPWRRGVVEDLKTKNSGNTAAYSAALHCWDTYGFVVEAKEGAAEDYRPLTEQWVLGDLLSPQVELLTPVSLTVDFGNVEQGPLLSIFGPKMSAGPPAYRTIEFQVKSAVPLVFVFRVTAGTINGVPITDSGLPTSVIEPKPNAIVVKGVQSRFVNDKTTNYTDQFHQYVVVAPQRVGLKKPFLLQYLPSTTVGDYWDAALEITVYPWDYGGGPLVTVSGADTKDYFWNGPSYGTWTFQVKAVTVAHQTTALALLLDCSQAMKKQAPGKLGAVQWIRHAAKLLRTLMTMGSGIAAIRFDQQAQVLHPMEKIQPIEPTSVWIQPNWAQAAPDAEPPNPLEQFFVTMDRGLDYGGPASIGAGLDSAKRVLDKVVGYDRQAVLLLTAGQEQKSPWIQSIIDSHPDFFAATLYAVLIGSEASLSPSVIDALDSLGLVDRYLTLRPGLSNQESNLRFQKYVVQVLSDIDNHQIVLDPDGLVVPHHPQVFPFAVNEADVSIDVIVLSPHAEALTLTLISPQGELLTADAANSSIFSRFVLLEGSSVFVFCPRSDGRDCGVWQVSLRHLADGGALTVQLAENKLVPTSVKQAEIPYQLLVRAKSSVRLIAEASAHPSAVGGGMRMDVQAKVTQSDITILGCTVKVEIVFGEEPAKIHSLEPSVDGTFGLSLWVSGDGFPSCRIVAEGQSLEGNPLMRERTLTPIPMEPAVADERRKTAMLRSLDGLVAENPHYATVLAAWAASGIPKSIRKQLDVAGFPVAALDEWLVEHPPEGSWTTVPPETIPGVMGLVKTLKLWGMKAP
ncbi:MAG: hypothetical protein HUU55_09105 [Myxococcales bacterium]|nr:hypothetical protein [Myxococcales bacterium]